VPVHLLMLMFCTHAGVLHPLTSGPKMPAPSEACAARNRSTMPASVWVREGVRVRAAGRMQSEEALPGEGAKGAHLERTALA